MHKKRKEKIEHNRTQKWTLCCCHLLLRAHLCSWCSVSHMPLCSYTVWFPPAHLSHISLVSAALLSVSLRLHLVTLFNCCSLTLLWFVCYCPLVFPVILICSSMFAGLSSVFLWLWRFFILCLPFSCQILSPSMVLFTTCLPLWISYLLGNCDKSS